MPKSSILVAMICEKLDVRGGVFKSPGWVVAESRVESTCTHHHAYLSNREPLVRWWCFCRSREKGLASTDDPLHPFWSFILGAHATLGRRARLVIYICLYFENHFCSKLNFMDKRKEGETMGINSLSYKAIIIVDCKNENCKMVIRDWSLLCSGLEEGSGSEFGSYEIEGPEVFCRHWDPESSLKPRAEGKLTKSWKKPGCGREGGLLVETTIVRSLGLRKKKKEKRSFGLRKARNKYTTLLPGNEPSCLLILWLWPPCSCGAATPNLLLYWNPRGSRRNGWGVKGTK